METEKFSNNVSEKNKKAQLGNEITKINDYEFHIKRPDGVIIVELKRPPNGESLHKCSFLVIPNVNPKVEVLRNSTLNDLTGNICFAPREENLIPNVAVINTATTKPLSLGERPYLNLINEDWAFYENKLPQNLTQFKEELKQQLLPRAVQIKFIQQIIEFVGQNPIFLISNTALTTNSVPPVLENTESDIVPAQVVFRIISEESNSENNLKNLWESLQNDINNRIKNSPEYLKRLCNWFIKPVIPTSKTEHLNLTVDRLNKVTSALEETGYTDLAKCVQTNFSRGNIIQKFLEIWLKNKVDFNSVRYQTSHLEPHLFQIMRNSTEGFSNTNKILVTNIPNLGNSSMKGESAIRALFMSFRILSKESFETNNLSQVQKNTLQDKSWAEFETLLSTTIETVKTSENINPDEFMQSLRLIACGVVNDIICDAANALIEHEKKPEKYSELTNDVVHATARNCFILAKIMDFNLTT